jgi:hypothetical protein
MRFPGTPNELLPVKDMDRDRIRLLARREVAAALRRDRRTSVHTVRRDGNKMRCVAPVAVSSTAFPKQKAL